jgi:aspartate-semialdehyde dehydrogenase
VPSLSTRLHHRHESEELNPIYSSDRDLSQPEGAGIDLFVCGDQLRKGAALNAVQIAEALVTRAQTTSTTGRDYSPVA